MIKLMNTFLTVLQMGEAEAYYKIFPNFHLKDSNVTTTFVPTVKADDRSKFLQRIDENNCSSHTAHIKVEGIQGLYIEKPHIFSKYLRTRKIDSVKNMCPAQFAKIVHPSSPKETRENQHGAGGQCRTKTPGTHG